MPEDPKHPIIRIDGESEIEFKGYGRNVHGSPSGGVSLGQFKDKLTAVLSSDDVETRFAGKIFFEIVLRIDYYNDHPQSLFQKLGVAVRSVFPINEGGLRKVIVSGPEDTIERYKSQSRVNQEYLKCVEDIRKINSNAKIGESIRAVWRQNAEISVEISLLDRLSAEELSELRAHLPDIVAGLQFGRYTNTASGILSTSSIQQLSRIPLVKYISSKTEWRASNLIRGSSLSHPFTIHPSSNLNTLPKICVIDTGFGRGLQSHCVACTASGSLPSDDVDGHGTSVSALCMFSKDELMRANFATPTIGVISHKISEFSRNSTLNFFDELIGALELHKNQTRIFCFSWNCYFHDSVTYEDRLTQLDKYLQKNNLLLINSCGNIDREDIRRLFPRYPAYIYENNVLSPSESKYTFAVGSTYLNNQVISSVMLSSFTTSLLPMIAVNDADERAYRIKPELYAEGGFIQPGRSENEDIDNGILSITPTGHRQYVLGTSVSAPQVARAAAFLMHKYHMRNIETLKALLFLKSDLFIQRDGSFNHAGRSLGNDSMILDADDGFYFIFEEESTPHERIEDQHQNKINGFRWKFPVPSEIDYVEISICQSNNNQNEDCRRMSTRIVTSIHKPGTVSPLNKNFRDGYGTLGKWAPLVFGKYSYSRQTTEGLWDLYAYAKTRGVPTSQMRGLRVRVGVAVKITLKAEFLYEKDRIYAKILEMLGRDSSQYVPTLQVISPGLASELPTG